MRRSRSSAMNLFVGILLFAACVPTGLVAQTDADTLYGSDTARPERAVPSRAISTFASRRYHGECCAELWETAKAE